jgi:hypothetical protein
VVFAAQQVRDLRRHAAEHHIRGIDDVPVGYDLAGLCTSRGAMRLGSHQWDPPVNPPEWSGSIPAEDIADRAAKLRFRSAHFPDAHRARTGNPEPRMGIPAADLRQGLFAGKGLLSQRNQ